MVCVIVPPVARSVWECGAIVVLRAGPNGMSVGERSLGWVWKQYKPKARKNHDSHTHRESRSYTHNTMLL